MAMKLPTEYSEVVTDPSKVTMILYGPPKHGKSTIVSSFRNVLFAACEEGLNHIRTKKVGIGRWEDVIELADLLINEKHDFQTICFDTGSALFSYCEDYTCRQLGIDHPSDEEWGKGWKALKNNFQKQIMRLAVPDKNGHARFGLVFTGHDKTVEVKGRVVKTKRTMCDLSGTARKVLLPMVDVIGYCGFRPGDNGEFTSERVVHFHGSETVEAGDRTGKFPPILPMTKTNWFKDQLEPAFNKKPDDGQRKGPKKSV